MGVVFFIQCFQHTKDFPTDHERDRYERARFMLRYAVHHFEMTLVYVHVLNDQRLAPAINPTCCAALQGNANGAQQVALKPVHRKEA